MTSMKPRFPATPSSIGIAYNTNLAYNFHIAYNQTSTLGLMQFTAKPTATTKQRTVASAGTSRRKVSTSGASPRIVPTATMKAR
jgi:hypothetical protein